MIAHASIAAPSADTIATGAKYVTLIDRDASRSDGCVYDADGTLRWYYTHQQKQHSSLLSTSFPGTTTGFYDKLDNLVGRVLRSSLLPIRFQLSVADSSVGSIHLQSVLLNRYAITIGGHNHYTVHMPLFRLQFYVLHKETTAAWIMVGPGKRQWNILLSPSVADEPLVLALAFVHLRWYNFS